jgi:hypothetical protein
MKELSWFWIAVMAVAPEPVALPLAYWCWRKSEFILGNIAATVLILAAAFALIIRESIQLDTLARQCLDLGFVCKPEPSAFMRYAIYAVIGFVEVVTVFALSLTVERRMRESRFAPEWRR